MLPHVFSGPKFHNKPKLKFISGMLFYIQIAVLDP